MLNLDHPHPKDQNSNGSLLPSDWHKPHGLSLDAADASLHSVDTHFSPHSIDPVTPADAVDAISAPANPSPETPGDLLSAPNDNDSSSSSLTPAPSPENGRVLNNKDARAEGKGSAAMDPHTRHSPLSGGHAQHSRQSTPLTDLSNPNTPPRAKEDEMDSAGMPNKSKKEKNGDTSAVPAESSPPARERRDVKAGPYRVDGSGTQPPIGSSPTPQTFTASLLLAATHKQNGSNPVLDGAADHLPSSNISNNLKAPGEPPDEKASAILQLNAELLKVCMEFHARSLMQSPEFNAYSARLQSNLTWLAAAADREKHKQQMALPVMFPPPPVSFYSMQAINDLYERLPKLFAKEIARRKGAPQGNIAGVKRGLDPATDDSLVMRKRLDTGERRLSNPPLSAAGSPPHARSPSVMSNGPLNPPAANVNVGLNTGVNALHVESQTQPSGVNLGMVQQGPSQQQSPVRVSPEAMPMGNFQGLSDGQRPRQPSQLRPMPPKDPQRMPPPNGLNNPVAGNVPPATTSGTAGSPNNMMQAVLSIFGQAGVQNYNILQQGLNHPFVQYMIQNVPGFIQLPLNNQLQRMAVVQQSLQQARQQQQQRLAANMNGLNHQPILPDQASSFGRQGSPPNMSLQPQHSGQGMAHVSPPPQVPGVGFGVNGMGSMQPGMQSAMQQRPNPMTGQNMAGLPGTAMPTGAGINFNNATPQQRQLLLMQQQMHQRDGVVSAQQAYAAAQEKQRMEQQSRMSNHQHHSPPHSVRSPTNTGHGAMAAPVGGVPGMTGMPSPMDMVAGAAGVQQKRASGQLDPYQMALYNQAQQRGNAGMGAGSTMGMRPGTAMGMNPTPQQQQQQQQTAQFAANGGMYGGGMQGAAQPIWRRSPTPQQQQYHSISPAALQHHPDAGTSRPASSASNNPMMGGEGMGGGSLDSLFNWGGT